MSDGKPTLSPVQENPWYILATLAGEQTGDDFDWDLHQQNRLFWNRWASQHLDKESIAKLIENGAIQQEDSEAKSIDDIEQAAKARGLSDLPAPTDTIDFSNTEWPVPALFQNFYIPASAYFPSATFSATADFQSATFSDWAAFQSASFGAGASFQSATFSTGASFHSASFCAWASFHSASFSDGADFESATFSGDAYFGSTVFSAWATFESATFSASATFQSASFSDWADFRSASFSNWADFTNTRFESQTVFDDALFEKHPPMFFGANLHEGTTFHKALFPRPPDDEETAQEHTDAYERLKLEMDRLNRHEAELMFFGLELTARRYCSSKPKAAMIWLYGLISDYGQSVGRPLLGLLMLFGACAPLFQVILHYSGEKMYSLSGSYGLSVASLGTFVGLRREAYPDLLSTDAVPSLLKVASSVEGLFGAVLVFLLLLALRNRFRIK